MEMELFSETNPRTALASYSVEIQAQFLILHRGGNRYKERVLAAKVSIACCCSADGSLVAGGYRMTLAIGPTSHKDTEQYHMYGLATQTHFGHEKRQRSQEVSRFWKDDDESWN